MRKKKRFHVGKVAAAILLSVTMICTMDIPLQAAENGATGPTDQAVWQITKDLAQTYAGNVGDKVTLDVETNDTEKLAVYQWQRKTAETEETEEELKGEEKDWKDLEGQEQSELVLTVSQEDLDGRMYRCVITIGQQQLITREAKIVEPVLPPSQSGETDQSRQESSPPGEGDDQGREGSPQKDGDVRGTERSSLAEDDAQGPKSISSAEEDTKEIEDPQLPEKEIGQTDGTGLAEEKSRKEQKDKETLAAPECILRTDTVIAVKVQEDLEYSMDLQDWRDTGRFEDLDPDTEYTVSARKKATEGGLPGEPGDKLVVRTKKEAPEPPKSPKVLEVTESSISVEATEGQEYSIDKGETWQTQGTFTGLSADTSYEILARFPETEERMGSENSQVLTVSTESGPLPVPESPQAPELLEKTDTEIRIKIQEGQEYSIDGGSTWQDGGDFSRLDPATEYRIIGRVKATSENQAGKNSSPLLVKTKAGPPSAPDRPVLEDRSQTELRIKTREGQEYSIDGGASWQDSGTFSELKADTAYRILARLKETEGAVAGQQSQALEVKTLRDPWVPDMKENKVTGVKGSPYALGEMVKFQAVPAGMDDKEPISGDVRYVPTRWECSGYSGKWTGSPYLGSFKVEAQGTHYLKVYFQRQMYNGQSWKEEGNGCKVTVTFYAGNVPKTGDEADAALWLSLMVLTAGAVGLAAGRKRTRSSMKK